MGNKPSHMYQILTDDVDYEDFAVENDTQSIPAPHWAIDQPAVDRALGRDGHPELFLAFRRAGVRDCCCMHVCQTACVLDAIHVELGIKFPCEGSREKCPWRDDEDKNGHAPGSFHSVWFTSLMIPGSISEMAGTRLDKIPCVGWLDQCTICARGCCYEFGSVTCVEWCGDHAPCQKWRQMCGPDGKIGYRGGPIMHVDNRKIAVNMGTEFEVFDLPVTTAQLESVRQFVTDEVIQAMMQKEGTLYNMHGMHCNFLPCVRLCCCNEACGCTCNNSVNTGLANTPLVSIVYEEETRLPVTTLQNIRAALRGTNAFDDDTEEAVENVLRDIREELAKDRPGALVFPLSLRKQLQQRNRTVAPKALEVLVAQRPVAGVAMFCSEFIWTALLRSGVVDWEMLEPGLATPGQIRNKLYPRYKHFDGPATVPIEQLFNAETLRAAPAESPYAPRPIKQEMIL